jgi:hypothetical protein
MKKVYKITIFSLLRAIWLQCGVLILLLCILLPTVIDIINNAKYFKAVYIFFVTVFLGGMIIVWTIYPLVIYLNHYLYDKNTVISFDAEMNSLTYTNGKVSITTEMSDITTFTEIYYPHHKRLFALYLMRYYEIFFKNGTVLVVTSLVVHNLQKELKIKPRKEWTRDMFLEDDTKKINY